MSVYFVIGGVLYLYKDYIQEKVSRIPTFVVLFHEHVGIDSGVLGCTGGRLQSPTFALCRAEGSPSQNNPTPEEKANSGAV